MAFLIGGANSAADTGYNVANSCRFEDGDSAYMHYTPSSAGNVDKWTFSFWAKRGNIGSHGRILSSDGTAGGSYGAIVFHATYDDLIVWSYNGTGFDQYHRTNRQFKDPAAWYHIVIAMDTTQSTAGNRVKIYVNGTQETSFRTETVPDQNTDMQFNHDSKHWLGTNESNNDEFYDGYLAEVCFIDGTQYAASDFGEFDEDSPTIWKPKDVSGLTFGTNGYYLDFEDSSNLGNDKNGGTDLTEVNLAATDQTTDTPTNNFATFNFLTPSRQSGGAVAYSEGNVNIVTSYTDTNYLRFPQAYSTLGATAGKWYAEFKPTAMGSAAVGIANTGEFGSDGSSNPYAGYAASGAVYTNGGEYRANDGSSGGQGTYTTNDIIGVAMDLDNLKLYWHKNGTYINSGDPESGATGTGARAIVAPATPGGFYVFTAGSDNTNVATISGNFGNPSYANSSSVSDANGYGDFEYAVPSGYLALCTKNLGSDGG